MMVSLFLVVLCVTISIPRFNSLPASGSLNNHTICIADGCLQGKVMLEESYVAYLGIPFAEAPIGSLRFSNPVATKPWSPRVLNATVEKSDCIQKNVLLPNPTVTGSEDCLYLNVYRPIIPRQKRLPVMVFIHGGGYFAGSPSPSMVGPRYFMETGEVIFVAMAYRLGVLGFLSTGDEHSTGNFGLKDQTLALRWVKSNIRAFGGDDGQITIFGVSAGASSVHMHMMSPLSQGLFHKAIVMSGSAIAPYNDATKNPYSLAKKQAEKVGIQGIVNSKDLVAKLRKIDAVKLVDSIDELKMWSVDPLTLYRPVIEPNITGAFQIQDPKLIWQRGQFQHVPWMTGTVQREGAVRAASIVTNKDLLDDLNTKLKELLPKLMEIEFKSKSRSDEIFQKLKDYYLNGSDIVTEDNLQGFIDMFSDRAFMHPYYKTVRDYVQYANTNRNPVSLYRFTFKGPVSYSLAFTGTSKDFGVVHLDDTLYLFQSLFPPFPENSVYSNVTKALVDFYVSFAKNGRPTHISKDIINECTKFDKAPFCDYQEFSSTADGNGFEVRTENTFDYDMIGFWDDILQ